MKTEAEARETQCHRPIIDPYQPATETPIFNWPSPNGCCIASDCMAWRWALADGTLVATDRETKNVGKGYCGCVGKPE